MRYTIRENAVNSLDIATKHFKKFFYHSKKDKNRTKYDDYEDIKVALIFLENAIELLLKSLLITNNSKAIYMDEYSKIIASAECEAKRKNTKLENVLIARRDFQTITFWKATKQYTKEFGKDIKLEKVFEKLSSYRNTITHFGIDEDDYANLVCVFYETYEIIYNNLYPRLIKLEETRDFFTNDDIVFLDNNNHPRFLIDSNHSYNNFIDFVDELLLDGRDFITSICAASSQRRIAIFSKMMKEVINGEELHRCFEQRGIGLIEKTCDFKNNIYHFSCTMQANGEEYGWDFYSSYLPFYNTTIFVDETGQLLFVVEHAEGNLFYYVNEVYYPEYNEQEEYYQWRNDYDEKACVKCRLSQKNLLIAFKQSIELYLEDNNCIPENSET